MATRFRGLGFGVLAMALMVLVMSSQTVWAGQSAFQEQPQQAQPVQGQYQALQQPASTRKETAQSLATAAAQYQEFEKAGKYSQALPLAQRLYAYSVKRHGKNHDTSIGWMVKRRGLHVELGHANQAIKLQKQVYQVYRDTVGENNYKTENAFQALVKIYEFFRRYDEAEGILLQNLERKRRFWPEDDIAETLSLVKLGSYYQKHGNDQKAVIYFQQAILICEKKLRTAPHNTVNSHYLALALSRLGASYYQLGKKQQGISCLKRAIGIGEKLRDQITALPEALYNLGIVYLMEGQSSQGIDLLKKSLNIYRKNPSGVVSASVRPAHNLGVIYYNQHDDRQARPFLEEALKLYQKMSGQGGIGTKAKRGDILSKLAVIYQRQGDINKAEAFLLQAAKLAEKGDEFPVLTSMKIASRLAIVSGQLNKAERAEYYAKKALGLYGQIGEVSQRKNDLVQRNAFFVLGLVYAQKSRENPTLYQKAKTFLTKVLALIETEKKNDMRSNASLALGLLYLDRKDYTGGQPYLLQAFEGFLVSGVIKENYERFMFDVLIRCTTAKKYRQCDLLMEKLVVMARQHLGKAHKVVKKLEESIRKSNKRLLEQ